VPFARLQTAQLGRSLAQIADRESDHAELFLEHREEVEVCEGGESPGVQLRREQGFAVRLLRQGKTWLASRDRLDSESLRSAIRQVARAVPSASYLPEMPTADAWFDEPEYPEVLAFPSMVRERIRELHVAFPARFSCARYRRTVQVAGTRFVSDQEEEGYYGFVADLPWGRNGALLPRLDGDAAAAVANELLESFRARDAAPAIGDTSVLVLGPSATAIFLHEAVAHALEADTLALGGRPEAACGYRLGGEALSILDDPRSAPQGICRLSDDEGIPTIRRWLMRQGEVREPLADVMYAGQSILLSPGAARRGSRHLSPVPRSLHLELLAGEASDDDLRLEATGGLFLPLVSRGALDPLRGDVELQFPFGRRITPSGLGEFVGPCRLRGRVADLLQSVTAVGGESRFAGAGWCAKGGHRLPVWATCPSILLEGLEVEA
jgi:predicted Zn-dependent protease